MIKDRKSYRILVIEDNEGDLIIVEDFLTETILAPVILHASNFKTASEILKLKDSSFDIILLDLSLPDKSGRELVKEILLLAPSVPVIILTGYTDIEFSIRSISQGIIDYLLKDDMNAITLYKSVIYAIERKKAISALKDSEKRFSDLFNLSPQPMWVFKLDTLRFIQVNRATIELYEYSEAEFLSMTLLDFKMEEDLVKTTERLRGEKEGRHLFKETVRHFTKSGRFVDLEIYSTPILLNNELCRSVIAIDVTEKNQQDRRIIKAIIKTQEDERYEIGGELHDNVCQLLAVSQLSLGMLKSSLRQSGIVMFEQCKKNIGQALEEIRNLSHRLAPVFFDDTTLDEALRRLIESFNIDNNYSVAVYVDPALKKFIISPEIQLNLYRIMQEQLRNIIKYAKGSEIEVDVIIYNNTIRMKIADNGVGFNPQAVKNGIGLANIKRRTELFSGKFELISSPGNGCVIIIEIPIQTHQPILLETY